MAEHLPMDVRKGFIAHTCVSSVNLVPAIRSNSNSFVFLFLKAAMATIESAQSSSGTLYAIQAMYWELAHRPTYISG
jgi:hypothetical protein